MILVKGNGKCFRYFGRELVGVMYVQFFQLCYQKYILLLMFFHEGIYVNVTFYKNVTHLKLLLNHDRAFVACSTCTPVSPSTNIKMLLLVSDHCSKFTEVFIWFADFIFKK